MRVLILFASAGSGHKRAAEALAGALRQTSGDHDIVVRDILDFTPLAFRETYAKGYLRLVRKAPELWGYMYTRTDKKAHSPWRKWVRSVFNAINAHSFFDFCEEFCPDCILCTHFLPLELISSRSKRKKMDIPFFACVTDFAVHSLWIAEAVDCYYVATEEARRHLIRRGQPEARIRVTGIPVAPVFSKSAPAKSVRKKLGIKEDLPVILSLSGGFGVGPALDLIRSFKGASVNVQLLVVAGATKKLEREARAVAGNMDIPITVFGFVDNIHELMDASDIIISKPGGLTSSEALAKGVPLLIVDPIPGQEQRNCEFLLEAGAAARLFEIDDAPWKIASLLDDPRRLLRIKSSAKRLGKPRAAFDIADDILKRCKQNA